MRKRGIKFIACMAVITLLAGVFGKAAPVITANAEMVVESVDDTVYISEDGYYQYRIIDSQNKLVEITKGIEGKVAFTNKNGVMTLELPSTIMHKNVKYTVTSLGGGAFHGVWSNGVSNKIVIPDTVTSIGDRCFNDCEDTVEFDIPSSVTHFGDEVFLYTPWLVNARKSAPMSMVIVNDILIDGRMCTGDVVVPGNVTEIAPHAFYSVLTTDPKTESISSGAAITSIKIPSSVKKIGEYAFLRVNTLKKVEIAEGLENIDYQAFAGCTELEKINFPSTLKSVGSGAFYLCSSLESADMSATSVKKLWGSSFMNCEKLCEIKLPDSLEKINIDEFNNDKALKKINIPDKVSLIGKDAFRDCSSMTELVLPKAIREIGETAFEGIPDIKITVPENVTDAGSWVLPLGTGVTFRIKAGSSVEEYMKDNNLKYVTYETATEPSTETPSTETPSTETPSTEKPTTKPTTEPATEKTTTATTTEAKPKSTEATTNEPSTKQTTEKPATKPVKKKIKVSSITLDKTSMKIKKGESSRISATVKPLNADNRSLVWSSSDIKKVSVQNGKITALNEGTVTITAVARDGSGVKAKCRVTVISKNAAASGNKKVPDLTKSAKIVFAKTVDRNGRAVYTGKAIKPRLTVTAFGKKLKAGTDYTVKYTANKNIGRAKITLTGKGKYKGTVTKYFRIITMKGKVYKAGNYKYKVTNAALNGKGTVTLISASIAGKNVLKVPDTVKIGGIKFRVTAIGAKACQYKRGLKRIIVGNNVRVIGSYAFRGCTSLSSVQLGKAVTVIDKGAFSGDKKIQRFVINSRKLKRVGKNAFNTLKTSPAITYPKGLEIRYSNLTKIVSTHKQTVFRSGSLLYTITASDTVSVRKPVSKTCISVDIPNCVRYAGRTYRVTAIQARAFMGCRNLRYVNGKLKYAKNKLTYVNGKKDVGNNVTVIGDYAFKDCVSLRFITTGRKLVSIGRGAFANDSKLEILNINSNKLKTIKKNAMYGVEKLNVVTPPKKAAIYLELLKKSDR